MPHPSEWPTLQSILQSHNEVAAKYTLTPRLWEYLQDYRAKHEKAGNGFGYSLFWTGRCGPHPLGPLLVREPDPLDRDAGLVCGLTEKSAEGVHALDSCPRDTCGSTSVPVTVFTPTPAKYSESEPACMSALIDRTHHGRVRSAMHQADRHIPHQDRASTPGRASVLGHTFYGRPTMTAGSLDFRLTPGIAAPCESQPLPSWLPPGH